MDLDDAFANAAYIPQSETFPPRWTQAAEAFRVDLVGKGRARLAVPYGPGSRQAYDMFLPDGPAKGLFAFVHGGYWLKFDRSTWSHFAGGALARGHAVAMPSYDLCPAVSIPEITQQISAAIAHAARQVDGPIRLAGHSAGGHLVARMTDPAVLGPDTLRRLTHVMPISPVADLRPLMRTSMNADLGISPDIAAAESPVLHAAPSVRVSVWVGAAERPVFVEQAQSLANAWNSPCTIEPGLHHFDVIDGLLKVDSPMMCTLFDPD